ncbi:MAG: hypothetical protein Kow0092_40430 [Deferrisomatales bacterium]
MAVLVLVLAAVLGAATVGFSLLEGLAPVDALYFSVVTVATVGFGDIHPKTPEGKLLTVALIVTGVGTFLAVIATGTDRVLARRQEAQRKARLHMVEGLFFSEIGTELLRRICRSDPELEELEPRRTSGPGAPLADLGEVRARLRRHRFQVDQGRVDLEELRVFLAQKSGLLLRFLENPNLMDHESFTELLRAVFHLKEELLARRSLDGLPPADRSHLAGDVHRVYPLLANQWLSYAEHLRAHYPYLFSLTVRTHPFAAHVSAVVREEAQPSSEPAAPAEP